MMPLNLFEVSSIRLLLCLRFYEVLHVEYVFECLMCLTFKSWQVTAKVNQLFMVVIVSSQFLLSLKSSFLFFLHFACA